MNEKKSQEKQPPVLPRRRVLGKLVWTAPAIVATATVAARSAEVTGGGGGTGGSAGGCGP